MKPCEFIEKLATENKPMADALDNKRFAGMKRILADFYPDNAHFIYELLQNAEDTHATKISFELEKDRLIYQHNGKRTFTKRDIESITSIGDSSKADDINSIGKFGVGFKAVFSYTNSPQIYSSDYAFEINNLVVPKCIPDIERDPNITIFTFPFNNHNKNEQLAYNEIKTGLEKLHDNTLLFLQNINEISVVINEKEFTIKRDEIDAIQVDIHNSLYNKTSRWLRFKKKLPDHNHLYVSIAYALRKSEKSGKDEIVPISGKVSIFFPAEKETSNLRFHIHAPFASTVARDSFKHDLEANKRLIELISETITDSLDYLKNHGFLTIDFLGVMPNHKDTISFFYQPIFLKCIKTFRDLPFMITESGEYQPSDVCYHGSHTLKKLIDDNDLRVLTNHANVYWSKNALRNSRSDDFIQSLNIDQFDDDNFYKWLKSVASTFTLEKHKKIVELFSSKSDDWYLKFYNFLKSYVESNYSLRYSSSFLKFFIRLNDDRLNTERKDCFFMNGIQDTRFLYVKKETYTLSKNESDNEKAKTFLESLGVKEVGEKEKIEAILNLYKNGTFPNFDEHINHIDTFLHYFKNSNDVSIFENKYFLVSTSTEDGKNYWGNKPNTIIMDEPYIETGLRVIAKYVIDNRYKQRLSDSSIKEFIILCKAVGVKYKFEVIKTSLTRNNPDYLSLISGVGKVTNTTTSEDWTIEDLENLLMKPTNSISLLIWNVVRHSNSCLKARYRPNQSHEFKYADSTLVHLLKLNAWIPEQDGIFYKPADMTQENLPSEFVYDNRNGWLKAIGFGSNNQKNKQYEQSKAIVEDTMGIPLDLVEKAKKSGIDIETLLNDAIDKKENENTTPSGVEPLDIIGAIQKHEKSNAKNVEEIDPTIVTNNDRFLEQVRKRHNYTIQKSTIAKLRNYTTKIKVGKEETQLFLDKQYKGRCQICGFTFTKKDGKNYFELLDWSAEKITKFKSNLILPANSLCVCSNCHSMIKLGSFDPEFIRNLGTDHLSKFTFDDFCTATKTKVEPDDIPESYQFIEMDMYKLPIMLIEEKKYIFYSEEHFLHFFDLVCLARE